jgi:hypothetical protein
MASCARCRLFLMFLLCDVVISYSVAVRALNGSEFARTIYPPLGVSLDGGVAPHAREGPWSAGGRLSPAVRRKEPCWYGFFGLRVSRNPPNPETPKPEAGNTQRGAL